MCGGNSLDASALSEMTVLEPTLQSWVVGFGAEDVNGSIQAKHGFHLSVSPLQVQVDAVGCH